MNSQGVGAQLELARRYTRRLRRHLEGPVGLARLDETVDRLERVLTRLESLTAAQQTQAPAAAARHEPVVASDGLLRQLAESNLLGLLSFRLDGTIDDANDYFLNLVGRSRADLDAGRLNWRRMTPPEHIASDDRALEEVKQHGFCTPFEKEYVRSDGRRIPVLLAGTLLQPDVGLAFVLDRSEQKRAHERLLAAYEELEKRVQQRTVEIVAANRDLRAVLESSPDIHFRFSAGGEFREYYANSATELYTLPEAFLGRTLDEVLPSEVARLLQRAIDEVLETGSMKQVECQLPMPNGAQNYEARMVPFCDGDVLAIVRNVTDRYVTAAALHDSEARFESAFRYAPIGMTLVHLDGRPFQVNRALCEMLGYSEAELLQKSVRDVTHPDDMADAYAHLARLLKGECTSYQLEKRYFHKDGRLLWGRLSASLVRDASGAPSYVIIQVNDTTVQQEAYAQIRESEQRFLGAFLSAPTGMTLVALDGRPLQINAALCEMLGYTEEEALALPVAEVMHPDDMAAALADRQRLIDGSCRRYQAERRYFHKSGRVVWTQMSVSLVRDDDGNPLYLISHLGDITARKQAEQALRDSEEMFQTFMRHCPAAAFLKDEDGRYLYINPVVERVFELPPDQWVGRTDSDIWPGWVSEEIRRNDVAVLASGQATEHIETIVHADGEHRWLALKFPVRDPRGRRLLAGMSVDVTEREKAKDVLRNAQQELEKRVEQRTGELAQANRQLRNILEGITDGFLAIDGRGCLVYVNPSGAKLLRLDRESSVGRSLAQVLPESLGTPFYEQYRKVMVERCPVDVEAYYPPLRRWLYARAYPSPEGMSVLFEDVSERHAREVTTVSDILRAINAHVAVADAFPEVAAGLKMLAACDRCDVSFFDESYEWVTVVALCPDQRTGGELHRYRLLESPARADILAGEPHVVTDLSRELEFDEVRVLHEAGYRSRVSLPLRRRDQVIGVLNLAWRDGKGFDARLLPSVSQVADAVALAVEKNRLFEEVRGNQERLRVLSRRLMEVQETERRLLASELHDEVGQTLTALRLLLDAVDREAPQSLRPRLDDAQKLTDDLIEQVRRLSLDLRPAMLDDLGLLPALLWLFERYTAQTGVRVEFAHNGLSRRFSPDVETAAFRIVQEALTNVARHAQVSQATVRAWTDADSLAVQINDEGNGFDVDGAVSRGMSSGLAGMRERAVLLGGAFSVESAPGTGTCLSAHLPLGAIVNGVDR